MADTRIMHWALACLVGLLGGDACAQRVAEGGSPLYSVALHESIEGLKGRGRDKPAAAGLVCPVCGKVHPPAAADLTNHVAEASVSRGLAAGQPCPICGQVHYPVSTGSQTNLTAAARSALQEDWAAFNRRYYYCTNCKAYHLRQPVLPVLSSPLDPIRAPAPSATNGNQKAVEPLK